MDFRSLILLVLVLAACGPQQQPVPETAEQPSAQTEVRIQEIGVQRAVVSKQFSYQAQAYGDGVTFADDTGLFDISADGQVVFTPTAEQAGEHQVMITATDKYGNQDTETVLLTITKTNVPPQASQIGTISIPVDRSFVVPVRASDPDGDLLTYRLLPEDLEATTGMTIDRNGRIHFAPSTTIDVPFRVVISDGTDQTIVSGYFEVY